MRGVSLNKKALEPTARKDRIKKMPSEICWLVKEIDLMGYPMICVYVYAS